MKLESYTVHEEHFESTTKPHNLPIMSTSSFNFSTIEEGIDIFKGDIKGHVYTRYGNPTIETVAKKIARMEVYGTTIDSFGIMVSSGMAAISTLVYSELNPGDTLLTQANLYGGSTELFKSFVQKLNINLIFCDLSDSEEIRKVVLANSITMIYCESPANPSLACVDLESLASIAKNNNIISVIDNTFCTPFIQQPLALGFDFSLHSTTKYLNGHGNSIAGIIVGRDKKKYENILNSMKLLGTNCNAFDSWLLNNGLKTLALRMQKHSENALELASRLSQHKKINLVNYPFLKSHPQYNFAKNQMKMGGGMLSIEVNGGIEESLKFMNNLHLCTLAPTLGDVDTLILHPATMSHRNIEKSTRIKNGISDGLIRMSVGIEHIEDLFHDIDQALQTI